MDKIVFKRSQADPKIYYFTLNNFVKTMAVVRHVNSLIKNKVTIELGIFCSFDIISYTKSYVS